MTVKENLDTVRVSELEEVVEAAEVQAPVFSLSLTEIQPIPGPKQNGFS